jgi:Copper type II ascorbate-dependent monooxygenase, C-terminal domain
MRKVLRRSIAAAGVAGLLLAASACTQQTPTSNTAANNAPAAPAPLPTKPPATTDAPLRAGEHFETVGLARPFTPVPPAGATDEYRCFLVDPHITAKSFLMGSQFMPQNGAIVHHAILYKVDPSDVASAKAADAADPGDGWTCFGGDGVGRGGASLASAGNGSWIGAWAPGAHETLLGDKLGYGIGPGTQLVMQIHYNLLATNGKPGETDRTKVRLRLSEAKDITALQTMLVAAPIELPCTAQETGPLCDRTAAIADLAHRFGPEAVGTVQGLTFLCDAGQPPKPGNTQSCEMRVRKAGTVYSVAGHMHLLGVSISVELNPGSADPRMLLDLPHFNFDDQGARPLVTPVKVKAGDMLKVTCTYDASLRSKLPQLKNLKPRYVVWGDGTSDEMCLGIVAWTPGV